MNPVLVTAALLALALVVLKAYRSLPARRRKGDFENKQLTFLPALVCIVLGALLIAYSHQLAALLSGGGQ